MNRQPKHHVVRTALILLIYIFVSGAMNEARAWQESKANQKGIQPAGTDEVKALVYFIGTVERLVSNRAIIDLGEVHSLRPGDDVVLFRSRDNQFQPLGALKAAECFPTWMVTQRTSKFSVEAGDIVLFVRTAMELGTGPAMRDKFLADQHLGLRNRNGYSTFRMSGAADTLMTLQKEQPRWIQYDHKVAGEVYGQSLGRVPPSSLQRLLRQINWFRTLETEGLPASSAASTEWKIVMTHLLGGPLSPVNPLPTSDEAADSTFDDTDSAARTAIQDIQSAVARRMFDRNPEEQSVASVACLCLLRTIQRNESSWLQRNLSESQFPLLSTDEQYLKDVAAILRQLREQEQ